MKFFITNSSPGTKMLYKNTLCLHSHLDHVMVIVLRTNLSVSEISIMPSRAVMTSSIVIVIVVIGLTWCFDSCKSLVEGGQSCREKAGAESPIFLWQISKKRHFLRQHCRVQTTQHVIGAETHNLKYLNQFLWCVIPELQTVCHAPVKTRITPHESVNISWVSCENKSRPIWCGTGRTLYFRHYGLHRFRPEIVHEHRWHMPICFIHEQGGSLGSGQDHLCFDCHLADVVANQVLSLDIDARWWSDHATVVHNF